MGIHGIYKNIETITKFNMLKTQQNSCKITLEIELKMTLKITLEITLRITLTVNCVSVVLSDKVLFFSINKIFVKLFLSLSTIQNIHSVFPFLFN